MKIFKSNIQHDKRVEKIAFKTNIKPEVVEETLGLMYGYIRDKFDGVDINKEEILSEEEFNKAFPIICIPSLGFFKPVYGKYINIMKNKLKKNEKRRRVKDDQENG